MFEQLVEVGPGREGVGKRRKEKGRGWQCLTGA